jgi:hypothetical protein
MSRRAGLRLLTTVIAIMTGCVIADAAEPSRGRPYSASPLECLKLDSLPRNVPARDRRIVDALARRGTGSPDDRCAVTRLTRYGGYSPVSTWNVSLRCLGQAQVIETWTQNGDGSVTIDRDGSKTTVRACGR